MTNGRMPHWIAAVLTLRLGTILLAGAQVQPATPEPGPSGFTIAVLDSMSRLPGGLGALPDPPVPSENPQTEAKIDLGRLLFHDTSLSLDHSISCATCHNPGKAYSDGRTTAVGIGRKPLARRAPSLLNVAYNSSQFWDGRAHSLEEQAMVPMLSVSEMGMPDGDAILARLRKSAQYRRRFRGAFGREINVEDLKRAIAAFERTLVTPDSAFDRYAKGDKQALTVPQKRGLILFVGKAACAECHNGPNFTDNKFHALGLFPSEREDSDLGHFAVTGKSVDRHAFKTPGLRNVSLQSPYMHNGSIATLPEVIEFYNRGGGRGPKSPLIFKLQLTAADKEDLLTFLQSLAGRMPADDFHP